MADLVIDTRTAVGAVGSCTVTIEPTDAQGVALAVFDGDGVQVRRLSERTDSTGTVTLDVTPTSEIQGTGRYYTVAITDSDGGEWTFLIEKSGATQTLYQALVVDPEDLGLAAGIGNLVDGARVTDLEAYRTPRGPELVAIGTSIERGTGGDSTIIGTFADGRPSNADWALHACANSELVYRRQAGSGGDSVGGIGVLLADAEIGSETLDIGFSYPDWADDPLWTSATLTAAGVQLRGPHLPYRTQTVFFDYGFSDTDSTGPDVEACYVNTVPVAITGGVRCTLLAATTVAHSAGDLVRWGMIGRFEFDVARMNPDIVGIGGLTNDLDDSAVDGTGDRLTAAEIAEGVEILCDMCDAIDAVPVVTTICARSDLHTETDAANVAVRALAATNGYRLADFWRVTVDPVTGDQRAEITADNVHPNQQGAEELGAEFVAALSGAELRGPAFRAAASDDLSSNMAPNGTFSAGTSGSGGTLVPVGWEVQEFFSSNILNTVVPPELTDPVKGNLHRITSAGGKGTHGSKASISIAESGNHAGFETGDLVYMRAWIRLRGFVSDGFCKANVRLICTGADGASSIGLIWDWGRDFDGGWITSQANIIPASVGVLSSLSLQIYIEGPPLAGADVGYGIFDVGEITLGNLTRGGL